MQPEVIMQGVEIEREALDRLPGILADLFDEASPASAHVEAADRGIDAVLVDGGGRRWLIDVKSSGSPGVVAKAAEQLERYRGGAEGIAVLVVPYMTVRGARLAAERSLNWIDLSGNAQLRCDQLYISVQGRPNQFASVGRPASPFAPKSSRVARTLLLEPDRWWRQKDLAERTDLDPGRISRVVRALDEHDLLSRDGALVRPRDAAVMLEAWAGDYRFDRHDIVSGHITGSGAELATVVNERLTEAWSGHAFTGLPAAWLLDGFARFRLVSVYVQGDPRRAADAIGMRRNERGANIQLIGPDDRGVFDGATVVDGSPCVSVPQVLLDLGNLPERAVEAADHLRGAGIWP